MNPHFPPETEAFPFPPFDFNFLLSSETSQWACLKVKCHCSVHRQQCCTESQCQFVKEQEGEVGGSMCRGDTRGDMKNVRESGQAWRCTCQYQLSGYSSLSFVSSAPCCISLFSSALVTTGENLNVFVVFIIVYVICCSIKKIIK